MKNPPQSHPARPRPSGASRTFLFGILGTGLLSAAVAPCAHGDPSAWSAGNQSLEIRVDKSTGRIVRILDKASAEDYCDQSLTNATADIDGSTGISFRVGPRPAGLILVDELRDRTFSDLSDPGKVLFARESRAPGTVALTLEKQYPGAEFTVTETFRLDADHLRWDVRVHKTSGPDRTIRVVYSTPLPLGDYQAWAPISDAPFSVKPWLPFSIDYGQSTSGAVGEGRWRTAIPMMAFYSKANHRAISFTSPFEVPAVRIRFLTNTGAAADFHWNSRQYPLRERPYLQVSQEYLGARDGKDIETGLLIAAHPADWRPALGWVYSRYREYFDGSPAFEPFQGSFRLGYPLMGDDLAPEQLRRILADQHGRGARWEELHGHFPWYGLMIPDAGVKTWTNLPHPVPRTTLSRRKIAEHCRLAREAGVGAFLYYNVTESEHGYARQNFASSLARSESGDDLGAFRWERYPDPRACVLMNADPAGVFGRHMIRQAEEMVESYPQAAGFFWDVYGRSYLFDFAHDDGVTMVNNKPAYYPEFMYQRLMRDHIRPLLDRNGMLATANKPVSVASARGLDGIMVLEEAPLEEDPAWIAAQSYLGLNRFVMILDTSAARTEMMYLHCLRYGMFDTDRGPAGKRGESNRELAARYRPFIEKFRGRRWVFDPEALELPAHTAGNIFRLKDGSIMITMTSPWRYLRKAEGFDSQLEVTCRLPEAAALTAAQVTAIDLGATWQATPRRSGNTLRITVPRHAKATVILLSRKASQPVPNTRKEVKHEIHPGRDAAPPATGRGDAGRG